MWIDPHFTSKSCEYILPCRVIKVQLLGVLEVGVETYRVNSAEAWAWVWPGSRALCMYRAAPSETPGIPDLDSFKQI